ncbi:hypothetical protein BDN72DRAFT_861880 [Pluteus cervinus]|uniref:Uncharacterized protein n=1 Tax=Pluteus cervinus TaxID=181527 RepID=A0ACD3ADX1_9AGAR|nr:hypothetical protein BDN72DRAFT_861880 [Pluteus cervinus]
MPNQYKPLPPEVLIRRSLTAYFYRGFSDEEIAEFLRDEYDTSHTKSVQRFRKSWGLLSTRQQKYTANSAELIAAILELRVRFPTKGAEGLKRQLLSEKTMKVSRLAIAEALKIMEPEAVELRRRHANNFKRKVFYASGVNELWVMDQHDKWGPRYGLWLHNSTDPFTGYNNRMKIWWTNKNPRLVAKFFLDAVKESNATPMITQSDPGSENFGVANIQTTLRHMLDENSLGGIVIAQH